MSFSYENLRNVYTSKGYTFFDKGEYNLNIGGIRVEVDYNIYDDFIFVAYRDDSGMAKLKVYEATTDPGKYWLNNPMNPKGCAILIPGQYGKSHAIGLHRGKYEALVQVGKVKVYRDNDRDNEHDVNPEEVTTDQGMFGINVHRSNPYKASNIVDKWSAGCQVFSDPDDFKEFMKIANKGKDKWGNKFTYTLLEMKDITNYG